MVRFLVIEDNPKDLREIEETIEEIGAAVPSLGCPQITPLSRVGEQEKEVVVHGDYDVAIVDHHLHGSPRDGFETLALMRSSPRHRNTHAIVFTGKATSEEQKEFAQKQYGVFAYVIKWDEVKFERALTDVLARVRAERASGKRSEGNVCAHAESAIPSASHASKGLQARAETSTLPADSPISDPDPAIDSPNKSRAVSDSTKSKEISPDPRSDEKPDGPAERIVSKTQDDAKALNLDAYSRSKTAPLANPDEARIVASRYCAIHYALAFTAGEPKPLPSLGATVWIVPVVLTSPGYGAVGEVGQLKVDARTGSVIEAPRKEEVFAAGKRLDEEHRDALETSFLQARGSLYLRPRMPSNDS